MGKPEKLVVVYRQPHYVTIVRLLIAILLVVGPVWYCAHVQDKVAAEHPH